MKDFIYLLNATFEMFDGALTFLKLFNMFYNDTAHKNMEKLTGISILWAYKTFVSDLVEIKKEAGWSNIT